MESEGRVKRKDNPRNAASFFSVISFSWLIPIFIRGLKREFQEEDLYEPLKEHESGYLGDTLERAWRKETQRTDPSLWRALTRVFGLRVLFQGCVLLFLEVVVKIAQPLALSRLILFYSIPVSSRPKSDAYFFAAIIVGSAFLNVMLSNFYKLGNQHLVMKIRIACCSLIYRKALTLSNKTLKDVTIGKMVNLLSNDVRRFDTAMRNINALWVTPLATTIIVTLIYFHLGFTATVGAILLILFIPIQMYTGKRASVYRLATAFRTDERVRLMDEIISGIQVIKMYTWEEPFIKLVSFIRRREIKQILSAAYIRAFLLSLIMFSTGLSIYVCILYYTLIGNYITAQYVFVLTCYYSILKGTLVMMFPVGIADFAETYISIKRLKTFLLYEEKESDGEPLSFPKDTNNVSNCKPPLQNNFSSEFSHSIVMKGIYSQWSSNESDCTLSNINLNIKGPQIIAIIGQVGSGKSSLFQVILKELPLLQGTLQVQGKLSYASQEPWLFAGSVRQNILFGSPMDTERYQEVIKVCALEKDLSQFEYGDRTIVGDRGTTLSGGQKARINLARAIYKEADIYLLDDPLSAVDTHVGKFLFDECIVKHLRNKIVILVTHQLQYLHNADKIVVLDRGCVIQEGTYKDLKDARFDFLKESDDEDEDEEEKDNIDIIGCKTSKNESSKEQTHPVASESKVSGAVSRSIYSTYLRCGGPRIAILSICLLFALAQITASGREYFLSYWTNIEQDRQLNLEAGNLNGLTYFIQEYGIYLYSAIVACNILMSLASSFTLFKFCIIAAKNLHNEMFSHIVYATMMFFNVNPSGRILNRFSKDIGSVDEVLPYVLIDCLQIGLSTVGIIIIICAVNYWMIIVTIVVLVIFYALKIFFLRTCRNVKRLEGVTKSPIFTHLSASLRGLITIRAFRAEEILKREFDNHQDVHSSSCYMYLVCSRAFAYWLDLISAFYVASVTFGLLFSDTNYGGNVGLAITQAINLTGTLQWGMRQWGELENQMTSVERVVEYTTVATEPERKQILPVTTWPEEGNIEFKSVYLKYFPESPYVLKGLNFSIKTREKVGIVGRTGAGKSSLIAALFQLSETEGEILIDDLDVSKIPLSILRSKISVIPQEPVLFSGTLRKNLDPFEEYSDEVLWNALEQVQLKQAVADLNLGLNTKMCEGGSNFSVGQRQLVCLARAVVRKNKILILDEATANVDHHTDNLIQETIRKQFVDCTVLTIAHRLHTIMDSDKVLVLDTGTVMEFDHPHNLLQNPIGVFYSLVQNTGTSMASNLLKTATEAYERCQQK